ncbi:serine/threonine-protein phosphatase 4 regulatory subunit 4 [Folsomia candida]|uniref:serine/threonine-protein phosphatase 4 regulatory subunit 4 n=1 Tax=Folsomia candida TaxID=158441 RepID=UPI001604D242|nr:serine/threonine-protein phosphatase 4 regulatory subunit 4 [Folsomia candida]
MQSYVIIRCCIFQYFFLHNKWTVIKTKMSHPSSSQDAKSKVPSVASDVFQCCDKDHTPSGNEAKDVHRAGSAWSITNMPAEIAQFAIDAPIDYDAKAADIQRHKDDDNKDEFQRALAILQSNEFGQKVFAAQNLSQMISTNQDRAFKELLPAIENELKQNFDPEFHMAVADSVTRSVLFLLPKNLQRARQLINIASIMVSSANTEVSDSWYRCFDSLVGQLNSADLQREIVPHVVERLGKDTASVNAKRTAGRLMEKLANKLPDEAVAKKLFPTVEALCRDKDSVVRGTMCVRLPEVIVKLKEKDKVFPILNNLLNDMDAHVMTALLGALGKAVMLMNVKDPKANEFFQTAMPIFKKVVKKAYVDGNTELLTEFTSHFGQVTAIISGSGILSNADKLWFLDACLQLSRYGLPSSQFSGKGNEQSMPTGFINFRANMEFNRRHSALEALIGTGAPSTSKASPAGQPTGTALTLIKGNNNDGVKDDSAWACRANIASSFLPFLKFAKPLVDFRHGLHPIVVDLMHDPVPSVRAKMAKNIYPIMQYLGSDGALLNGEVVYSLADDDITVVEAIMPNLADILRAFVQAKLISPDAMTNATVEIGGALLFCEMRLSQTNDWRVHATMLEQLSVLPFCFPVDYVYNNFVPALFHRLLHMRQLPCRIAAADAIVSFLRHCRRSHQREEIRRRIKEGFAQGRSVHDRMLFLFMSKKIMEIFSRKYYRDHFFESTLLMTDDNIPNIRLKAVNMMPDLKGVLQMSEDATLLKKLEETLVKIKNSENDRDVQNAIEAVIPVMEKVGVVLKRDKTGPKTKEDLEDEAKEREEEYIASLEPPPNAKNNNIREKSKSIYKTSRRSEAPPLVPAIPRPPEPVVATNEPPGPPMWTLQMKHKSIGQFEPTKSIVDEYNRKKKPSDPKKK